MSKRTLKVLFVLILSSGIENTEKLSSDYNYFCDFPCGELHTVCRRGDCSPSTKCGKNIKTKLTQKERELLLLDHNKFRSIIAAGLDNRNGNTDAANMNALSYSMELEFVAQCWANACEYAHDKCRTTRSFTYTGQNIYEKFGKDEYKGSEYLTLALQTWFDQIEQVNASIIDNYTGETAMYNREFTQLVWATTTHVGCGTLARSRFHKNFIILICNYGPTGNIYQMPVYLKGPACSMCPTDKPCNESAEFDKLCGGGDILSFNGDKWKPPALNKADGPRESLVLALMLLVYQLFE